MSTRKGITTLELLFILVILGLAVATVTPAYLVSYRDRLQQECSLRLAVVQDAKKEVLEEMNQILPANRRLRITDKVNPLHVDKIAQKTLASPWRFHPEDPIPGCGPISVGNTFLDPPTSPSGVVIAVMETPSAHE
jgi:type II secretory pathway pseudopilin PulG